LLFCFQTHFSSSLKHLHTSSQHENKRQPRTKESKSGTRKLSASAPCSPPRCCLNSLRHLIEKLQKGGLSFHKEPAETCRSCLFVAAVKGSSRLLATVRRDPFFAVARTETGQLDRKFDRTNCVLDGCKEYQSRKLLLNHRL
jgi:hypothetical protein